MLFLTYRVYWSFWSLLIIFLKYILDDIFTGFIVFFCFESGLLWVTPRLIACSRTVTPVSRTNIWKNTTSLTELLLTSSKHREPLYWLCMLRGTWRLPHFYKGKKMAFLHPVLSLSHEQIDLTCPPQGASEMPILLTDFTAKNVTFIWQFF